MLCNCMMEIAHITSLSNSDRNGSEINALRWCHCVENIRIREPEVLAHKVVASPDPRRFQSIELTFGDWLCELEDAEWGLTTLHVNLHKQMVPGTIAAFLAKPTVYQRSISHVTPKKINSRIVGRRPDSGPQYVATDCPRKSLLERKYLATANQCT
jgi:hypothetical protein